MLQNIKKRTEGFTIIEVLIVLAIAGLIMLIVFLAVPALQRNSRNTARRTEAGRFATAANEFVSNNNGTMPTATDNTTIKTAVGDTQYLGVVASSGSDNNVSIIVSASDTTVTPANTSTTNIEIVVHAQCDGNTATAVNASARQMAVLYGLEPGVGACINV